MWMIFDCCKRNKQSKLVDLGVINKYLGYEVRRNQENFYFVKQSGYTNSILK